jgi:hypothetical protein
MADESITQSNQSSSQSLDPSVVALCQAQASAESGGGSGPGNYNAPNGGAYQFTPDTWATYSKKYLGQNVPLDSATPAQQDQVAYGAMKDMGDEGYNPAQVSSIWNTGLPNAYKNSNYGTNNYYGSTQKEVNVVEKNYYNNLAKFGIQPPDPSNPPTTKSDPTMMDYLGGEISKAINWIGQNPLTSLGIAGAGALGVGTALLAPELLPEEGAAAEDVAGAGETGASAEAPSLLSKIGGFLTGTAKTAAGGLAGAAVENTINSIFGNKQQGGGTVDSGTSNAISGILSNLTGDDMTQRNKSSTTLMQGLTQAIDATPNGRAWRQNPENQQTLAFGSMMGYGPEDKDGSFDTNSSFQQRQQDLNTLDKEYAQPLLEDEKGNIDDWGKQMKQSVANDKTILAEDREGFNSHIDEMVAANKKIYGNNPTLAQMHQIRKNYGKSYRGRERKENFNRQPISNKTKLHQHAYNAARQEIVSKSKNGKDYDALMKVEEKIIKFGEVEKKLKGKKIPYNQTFMKQLGREFGRAAGAYVGKKIGGPVGAVLGYMIEGRIQKAVEKRFGHNIFQTKGMTKVMEQLKRKSSEAYSVIKKGMGDIENQEKESVIYAQASVSEFVNRIKKGEKMTSPQDIEFYQNNSKRIEEELKKSKPASKKSVEGLVNQINSKSNVVAHTKSKPQSGLLPKASKLQKGHIPAKNRKSLQKS